MGKNRIETFHSGVVDLLIPHPDVIASAQEVVHLGTAIYFDYDQQIGNLERILETGERHEARGKHFPLSNKGVRIREEQLSRLRLLKGEVADSLKRVAPGNVLFKVENPRGR